MSNDTFDDETDDAPSLADNFFVQDNPELRSIRLGESAPKPKSLTGDGAPADSPLANAIDRTATTFGDDPSGAIKRPDRRRPLALPEMDDAPDPERNYFLRDNPKLKEIRSSTAKLPPPPPEVLPPLEDGQEEDSWLTVGKKSLKNMAATVGSWMAGVQQARADLKQRNNTVLQAQLEVLPDVYRDYIATLPPDAGMTGRVQAQAAAAKDERVIAAAKAAGVDPETILAGLVNYPMTEARRGELLSGLYAGTIEQSRLSENARAHIGQASRLATEGKVSASDWSAKKIASELAPATVQMGAAAATTLAAGPAAGLGVFAAGVAPGEYAEARLDRKYDPAKALGFSTVMTAAELAGEIPVFNIVGRTPLGKTILAKVAKRYADTVGGKLLATGGVEAVGEAMSEALQIGLDQGLFDKDTPWDEAVQRVMKAGVLGFAMGGALALPSIVDPGKAPGESMDLSGIQPGGPAKRPPGGPGGQKTGKTFDENGKVLPVAALEAPLEALEAPRPTGQFEVSQEGAATPLTQNDLNARAEQRARREELGLGPVFKAGMSPGERRKAIDFTRQVVLESADEEYAEPDEVTLESTDKGYVIKVKGEPAMRFDSKQLAEKELKSLKAALSDPERLKREEKAGGTESVEWKGITVSADRKESKLGGRRATLLTEDGSQRLEALVGPARDGLGYVIDEVKKGQTPDADQFRRHILVLGAESERQAAALYHERYKHAGFTIGAIQETSPDDLKQWMRRYESAGSVAWTPGQRWKAPAEGARRTTDKATVLGQEIERPETPTPGQAAAGNYKKPTMNWKGFEIKVENIKGSARSGVDETGQAWANVMHADYGYFTQAKASDGDKLDVFMGPHRGVQRAFVIDQLRPSGVEYDEAKVVIGAKSKESARDLYLRNYPKGWKGLGAITEMSLPELKTWIDSGETHKPLAWKAPAPKAPPKEKRSTRVPQAKHDSILEYLSKLRLFGAETSGISIDELEAEGLDPKELRTAPGHGINRPFTKSGGSLDHAAELLTEAGYPVGGDKNKLLDLITGEIRNGRKVYAGDKSYADLERELQERYADPSADDDELAALEARLEREAKATEENKEAEQQLESRINRMRAGLQPEGDDPFGVFEPRAGYNAQLELPFEHGEAASLSKLETRPDTTRKQIALGARALRSLLSLRHVRSGAALQGLGLPQEFAASGTVSLVGQQIASELDLAELAQVYRDPRFETLRFFFVKDTGDGYKVVHQTGVTSRLAGGVEFALPKTTKADDNGRVEEFFSYINQQLTKSGADGYYVLHNHPSGNPTPSRADLSATQRLAFAVKGFLGHIVIDNDRYSMIDAKQGYVSHKLRARQQWKTDTNPLVTHELLGINIQHTADLASIVKALDKDPNKVVFVSTDSRSIVRAVVSVPVSQLTLDKRDAVAFSRFMRNTGSVRLFAVARDPESIKQLFLDGYVTDIVDFDGSVSLYRKYQYKLPHNEERSLRLSYQGVVNVKNRFAGADDKTLTGVMDKTIELQNLIDQMRSIDGVASVVLYETKQGDIKLDHFAIVKDKRKQGIGTLAMRVLTDYADQVGQRIILTTGVRDTAFGTTSAARLRRFYARFGFVRNHGRNKDFTISANMYRDPQPVSHGVGEEGKRYFNRKDTLTVDMFGDEQKPKQDIADHIRKKDEARNRGQESVETGDPYDLFSQANKQQDIESVPPIEVSPPAEPVAPPTKVKTIPKVVTLRSLDDFFEDVKDGKIAPDAYKKMWEATLASQVALSDELKSLTKEKLRDRYAPYRSMSESKDHLVNLAQSEILRWFALTDTISVSITGGNYKDSYINAVRHHVESITQETLDKYRDDIAEYRKHQLEKIKGLDNPKTLEDFNNVIRLRGLASLTVEQVEQYDKLYAETHRETLKLAKQKRDFERSKVQSAGITVGSNVIASKHTKHGYDIFVVQLAERVERDAYEKLNATAKQLGGYYSSYRGGGAIPGFIFKERANAETFAKMTQTGDTQAASELAQERRDDYLDNKTQTTVERLRSMAQRLQDSAQEALDKDRKTNTARRAAMANRAEEFARSQISLAKTMLNIAAAIESGKAQYLDGVRTKAQIEMLRGFLNSAKYTQIVEETKAKFGEFRHSEYEKRQGEPPNKATARYVDYPRYEIQRGDLASIGRALVTVEGSKRLGENILKNADDLTPIYTKFVKENLLTVALRTTKGDIAMYRTKKEAEEVRQRSPSANKMAVVTVGKQQHYVVLSPREAEARNLWEGDARKIYKLKEDYANEIMDKINAYNKTLKNNWGSLSYPYSWDSVRENRARLHAITINTDSMLREALRELVDVMDEGPKADPVKQKMRELVGRKDIGIDFFPTPPAEAANIVARADITEGMDVLDAGAGYGAIADEIREAGVEPDVVEISDGLREILELKGYDIKARDFLSYSGKLYDRVLMNPPFSKDIEFIQHAYGLLKPGGRIVTVVGEGAMTRSDKKATAFREWLDSLGAYDETLPENTFMDSSLVKTTGARARVVVIDKPESGAGADKPMFQLPDRSIGLALTANDREQVRLAAQYELNKFSSNLRPNLIVERNLSSMPDDFRAVVARLGFDDSTFKAAHWRGTIYIASDRVLTRESLKQTILHELVTHFGTDALLTRDEKNELLDGLAKDNPMEVARYGVQEFGPTVRSPETGKIVSGFDRTDSWQRRRAAEEMMAYYGQKYLAGDTIIARIKRWLDRWIAAIRDSLRRLFGAERKFDELTLKRVLQDLYARLRKPADAEENSSLDSDVPVTFERAQPVFHSALDRYIEGVPMNSATPEQWIATIKNAKGVKPEEVSWRDLDGWLSQQSGQVSKDRVVEYLKATNMTIEEVEKTEETTTKRFMEMVVELSALGFTPLYERLANGELGDVIGLRTNDGVMSWKLDDDGNLRNRNGAIAERDEVHDSAAMLILDIANRRHAELDPMAVESEGAHGETKYKRYSLEGGTKYRELLLLLPAFRPAVLTKRKQIFDSYETKIKELQDRSTDWSLTRTERLMADDQALRLRLDRDEKARLAGDETYFQSSHWDESNVVAHVRFDARTDSAFKRVLHIAEVQSDWHQLGRKSGYRQELTPEDKKRINEIEKQIADIKEHGTNDEMRAAFFKPGAIVRSYSGEDIVVAYHPTDEYPINEYGRWSVDVRHVKKDGSLGTLRNHSTDPREYIIDDLKDELRKLNQLDSVSDAPFKTTWPALVMKRMIRYAVDNGFDSITWDTGQTNVDRYSLNQYYTALVYQKKSDELWTVWGVEKNTERRRFLGNYLKEKLPETVGQELADQIISGQGKKVGFYGTDAGKMMLEGAALQLGGRGMKRFYDVMLPLIVSNYVKKWGAKVGSTHIYGGPMPGGRDAKITVHALDITPEMREAARESQPMFQRAEAMQRTQPGTGEWWSYKQLADTLIDTWNKKIGWRYGPLGQLPEMRKYLIERYKTLSNLGQVRLFSREVFDTLKTATDDEKVAIYKYMTTAGAELMGVANKKVYDMAVEIKAIIDAQGRALVEAGLIPEESYEQYRDQYLPRIYLRHILADDAHSRTVGGGKKMSDLGYTKKRKDIPEEVRRVVYGEITDPAFLASFAISRVQRDLAMMRFLNVIAGNKQWTPPEMLIDYDGRKVSAYWLKAEAAHLQRQADHIRDKVIAQKARALASHLLSLASQAEEKLHARSLDDFEQIPDSPRYGALRGLWVRKEIHEDLVGAYKFVENNTFLERLLGEGGYMQVMTQGWKFMKVAANFPSHVRNMVSNASLLHMSGISMPMLPVRLFQAIDSIHTKDEYYQLAMKYGLGEATFANSELGRIRDEWVRMQSGEKGIQNQLLVMFSQIKNTVGDLYQLEEALFKIAKMRDEIEKGATPEDAMIEAHRWVFDYSLVPRWVRYLRNTPLGIPFITFNYFVLPRLMETAVRRPWKFAPYVLLGWALAEALRLMWGIDKDDLEKLRKAMPRWLQERGSAYLLPYKDEKNQWQVIDVGYMLPWGAFSDVQEQIANGNWRQAPETMGLLSGPIPDLMAAWQTGIDPFTRRPIIQQGDPPDMQAQQIMSYMWNMATPGMLNTTGAMMRIKDAYAGKLDPRTDLPRYTKKQAMLSFFGVSIHPFDPALSRDININFMEQQVEDVERRRKSVLRDPNLSGDELDRVDDVYQKELDRRREMLWEYMDESAYPEKLDSPKPQRELLDIIGAVSGGAQKRESVAKALTDAGHSELGALIASMPVKPRKQVAEALFEGAGNE